MKLVLLSLFAAGSFAAGAAAPDAARATTALDLAAVETWQDTVDTLWRKGRIAISEESWRDAAYFFERIATRYPNSTYAGDALYWQAFALQRSGSSSDMRNAVRALELQKEKYPRSATFTSGESSALLTRVNGRLARAGDPEAAVAIAQLAEAAAQMGAAVATTIAPAVAEAAAQASAAVAPAVASAMNDPETRRAIERAARDAERSVAQRERELATTEREVSRARGGQSRRDSDEEIPSECEGVIRPEQIEAINALLQMNGEQALPILKRVLERRDRCSEVLRRKAVFLVSQKRTDEAVDILVSTARTDPDPTTREQAVFWLSQTRSPRAVEVLEQILLRDAATNSDLQKRAIFALAQSRTERSGEILRDYVKRTDVSVESRGEAIFWLGQTRSAENSAFIREVFPTLDTDELRDKAIFSLSQQRTPENARFLLGLAKDRRYSADLRKSALFWASQQGIASVADLASIYDTSADDKELRNQVIFTLSQRRSDTAAVDKLLDIARREPDPELRRQALFWLGQSRDPRVAGLLEEIINKP
jgi:TolA-binding protein